jgi:lipoate-protein ligase A
LLHRNEINYAVIADTARAGIFGTGLAEGFCQISMAIAAGLGRLGVQAEVFNRRGRSQNQTKAVGGGICAATTTRYEITSLGKKLVAAAQLRSAERLLQHGTIYLNEAEVVPEELFGKVTRSGAAHMSSLSALLGGELDQDTIIQELIHGLCLTFGRFARRDSFDHAELENIDSLVNDQGNLPL